ncbi:chemotaxis protein CheX [Sanguibacter sp. HDW7]|uniref:chemotaxis protein CheX n=1 Tax=Sanguibacter sp. HDW7 TaxID=2714931 RepID=UPI00140E71DD|nr:chemotaxis protein CheX [Sanguibacter sp. HDW7]QIK84282.1 chemotaxis protein CheX [Sanguibacter sp. HDW7]
MTVIDAAAATPETVVAIAQDVFAALVDDGEVLVHEGATPDGWTDPVSAWVDMRSEGVPGAVRTGVVAERGDVEALVRALLREPDDAVVSHEDVVDAFGEIANVVGGNVKALLPALATLSLPQVAEGQVAAEGVLVVRVPLVWRGRVVVVSLAHVA